MEKKSAYSPEAEAAFEKFLEREEFERFEADLMHVVREVFLAGYELGRRTTLRVLP